MLGFVDVHLSRLLAAASTATSFVLAAASTVIKGYSANYQTRIPVGRAKTAHIVVSGTDAADETLSIRVFGAYRLRDAAGSLTDERLIQYLGLIEATLGTLAGPAAGVAVGASELIADGLVWTPSAFMTACETAYNEGTGTAYSGTSNDAGMLILPCLCRCDELIFDFDMTGAASGNVHVMLQPV